MERWFEKPQISTLSPGSVRGVDFLPLPPKHEYPLPPIRIIRPPVPVKKQVRIGGVMYFD